jgi:excisionase family DNA binding protein
MEGLSINLSPDVFEALAQRVAEVLAERHTVADEPESELMTVAEAADYLRCKTQRIRDLLSQGRLEGQKDGARRLVTRASVKAHLNGDTARERRKRLCVA